MRRGLIAAAIAVLRIAVVTVVRGGEDRGGRRPRAARGVHERLARLSGAADGAGRFPGSGAVSWLRFGAQKYNRENGTRFKVVAGHAAESAGGPDRGETVRLGREIMAVIGGSESQAVLVSGNLFERADLASVSGRRPRST